GKENRLCGPYFLTLSLGRHSTNRCERLCGRMAIFLVCKLCRLGNLPLSFGTSNGNNQRLAVPAEGGEPWFSLSTCPGIPWSCTSSANCATGRLSRCCFVYSRANWRSCSSTKPLRICVSSP